MCEVNQCAREERRMTRVRVHNFTVSLDGYGAGPNQSPEAPLGEEGQRLHEWIFETRSGLAMLGREGGETGLADELVHARPGGVGARSWAATCSDRSGDRGRTSHGGDGGARIPRLGTTS